ncbi:MAG TPA: phosphatidylglycerol lysyltransferase domain-containing protein [Smithella sp.]|nr:phosphatidylglycerol lysyltransferase domain-containing protein [Smithella sp.]
MEKIETIDLKHRDYLTRRFREMNLPISDYTFANVYLFRKTSHYDFVEKECGLFVAGQNRHGQRYIMPLNDPRGCDVKTVREILGDRAFLFPVPEQWLSHFPQDEFSVTYDDSESDYLYLTEAMADFKGKKYVRHRNHLHQFLALYATENAPIAQENIPDALEILTEWQNHSRTAPDKTDFEQCREALEYFSELSLWGTIYYIDRKPAGFIISEALNTDTFCLHFAKASRNYHGIYEFIFNDTAKLWRGQYQFLNLEEDMGNKNLRRTKYSYGPLNLIRKYRISMKASERDSR